MLVVSARTFLWTASYTFYYNDIESTPNIYPFVFVAVTVTVVVTSFVPADVSVIVIVVLSSLVVVSFCVANKVSVLVSVIFVTVSRDELLRDGQENVGIAVGEDPSWTDCIEVTVTVVVETGNDGQEAVPVLAELPSRETSSKSGLAVSKPPKSETPI